MNLFSQIDQWGRLAPSRRAFVNGNQTLTYGELLRRSDALAHHLAQTLPDDQSPVVVLGHKEPELLVGFLGCAKARHPYVPIDNILPQQRVERIIELSGARVILSAEKIDELTRHAAPAPNGAPASSDPYYIMFTSGSTGEPKGVVITLGNLTFFLTWLLKNYSFAEGETFLNVVAYSFDVSLVDTYGALLTGGTVFALNRDTVNNPRVLFQNLAASDITTWVSTPSFVTLCLAEKNFNHRMLPHLRRVFLAGEALSPQMVLQLMDRFPNAEIWNAYGPTETTVVTTAVRLTRAIVEQNSILPIGYPLTDTRVVVVNEAGQVVPNGTRGEIVIAGPNVSPGYLGRPDLTARAFFEFDGQRAYHTGDWGYVRDGMIFFEGRIDDQIKLHGYRIELGDIEANLRALPEVREVIVLPRLVNGSPHSLDAFVILRATSHASEFELTLQLRNQLAERLPIYMLPAKFHFLESFPMNANGKADRRKLSELFA